MHHFQSLTPPYPQPHIVTPCPPHLSQQQRAPPASESIRAAVDSTDADPSGGAQIQLSAYRRSRAATPSRPLPPDPNQRHGPEATMHTRVAVWPQDSSSPASRWRCTHWVVAWLSKAAARTPAAMCTSGSGMGPGSIVATHALKLKPLFSRFRSLPNSNSINLALISISMLQIECYQLVVIIRMLVEFFNIQNGQ